VNTLKLTLGSILAFVAVATLFYLGKVQYAPRIGIEVPITTLLLILVMWGSVTLLKTGRASTAAKVIELILASLLASFAWIIGLQLTGQRGIDSEPLLVGLIAVFIEAVGAFVLFRDAIKNPPMRPKGARITKIILAIVLFLMSLLSLVGVYEAFTLGTPMPERAAIFAVFAALEIGLSVAMFVSAFKRRAIGRGAGKSCPQCNRTYDDMRQNFCLDDGAILLNSSDPNATLVNPPGLVR
jgi:hypothetical protein